MVQTYYSLQYYGTTRLYIASSRYLILDNVSLFRSIGILLAHDL